VSGESSALNTAELSLMRRRGIKQMGSVFSAIAGRIVIAAAGIWVIWMAVHAIGI
jgi:hypothetical protein